MRLLPYRAGETDLDALDVAPGWPHDDTAAALDFAARGAPSWLILDDDDRVAGECGAKAPPDAEGVVEIGYGLAAGSRGRGLGTRAVAALLDALRTVPGARTVEAEVAVGNEPSRRLLQRLGFAEVRSADGYSRYRRAL